MWGFGIDPVALDVDPEGYDGPCSRAQPFLHRSGWWCVSDRRRSEATVEQRDLIDLKLSRLSTAIDQLPAEARRGGHEAREATNELEAAKLWALRRLGSVEDRMPVRWWARPPRTDRIAPRHWQEEAWYADALRERKTSPIVMGWGVPGRLEF